MSVFDKLNTLFRASVRESVAQVTDANAVRIYRQEIVEAEELLAQRRDALAATIATRRELEQDIEQLQKRIGKREEQVRNVPEAQRSESLLELAAREIASFESELASHKQRHIDICELISREEIALRKLLAEIREHRREIKLLESQVNRQRAAATSGRTISGRLAALRETRASIVGTIAGGDHLEAGMDEALQRVEGSPVDRELRQRQGDDDSLHVQSVLSRLRGLEAGA